MNYTAMTLASNAPPIDPKGANISFGPVLIAVIIIVVFVSIWKKL